MTTNRIANYRRYERLAPKYSEQMAALLDRASSKLEPAVGNPVSGHWLADRWNKFCHSYMADLVIYGDVFFEKVYEPDLKFYFTFQKLPEDTMYRIETVKGKLLEFQQSNEGPDCEAVIRCEAKDDDGASATAIRFQPDQIVHMRLGVPPESPLYGRSLIEKNPDLWDDWDAQAVADAVKLAMQKLLSKD